MGKRVVIIGGGAAGFFAARWIAQLAPDTTVTIFEAAAEPLRKVRISGGGRCNVTNACVNPTDLIKNYPRGQRELRGPFNRFGPANMRAWLLTEGVKLNEEDNGRLFPTTDDSSTIIDVLSKVLQGEQVRLCTRSKVTNLDHQADGKWLVTLGTETLKADAVLLAGGSASASKNLLTGLGIPLVDPVPSLFTFNIQEDKLHQLAGVSAPNATVSITFGKQRIHRHGPVLITHWGLSGPAILYCSAWAARHLHACNYQHSVSIDWLGDHNFNANNWLQNQKSSHGKRLVIGDPPPGMVKRLWHYCCDRAHIPTELRWANATKKHHQALEQTLQADRYAISGKTTFKEEFVTAGGIDLKAVNFKTMGIKEHPGLYAAGEILDIDAVTGGFNFQAAWTTAWIAAHAITETST